MKVFNLKTFKHYLCVPTEWSTKCSSASTNAPILDLHSAEYIALVHQYI